MKKLNLMTPLLEGVLSEVTKKGDAGLAQGKLEHIPLDTQPKR